MLDEVVCRLALDDQVVVHERGQGRGPQALYSAGGWPSHGVGLRVGAGGQVTLRTADGDAVGTVELARACEQAHPGASYLHAGQSWRVAELDLDGRCAVVEPDDGSTYTVARTDIEIQVTSFDARRRLGALEVGLGAVEVHQQVTGYQRKDALTGESLGVTPLDLPRSTLSTRAFWYRVPESLLSAAGVASRDASGALHAAEHAGIGVLPLFTICDRWDVGGVSTLHQPDIGGPAIVIYDGYQGGAGVAELGYEAAERHVGATAEVIAACACATGCPSCVQSPKCGNGNDPLDKAGALRLLRTALS
jgi:DEAD/DEAH box helicase domain-containing protein